jgi:hypothetical protein
MNYLATLKLHFFDSMKTHICIETSPGHWQVMMDEKHWEKVKASLREQEQLRSQTGMQTGFDIGTKDFTAVTGKAVPEPGPTPWCASYTNHFTFRSWT